MASQQEMNLYALGKAAYESRTAVRGSKSELAAELGFSNPGAMSICADRIFYGKVAPSRQSGNDGDRRPRQSTNSVSAIRQALEDMKSVGLISDVPSLHVGPVENLTINPAIAEIVQPYFDAIPLNAAFVLAFRHVQASQLKEFGLVSNEMREQDNLAAKALLDREMEAKAFLKTRGFDVVVSDHLADDIAIWTLRLIESSDFEIGLLHAAETKAAIAETERLAAIAAAAAAAQATRLHDAQTVSESLAIDASEREKAALEAAKEQADKNAALQAQIAAMQAQMAELLAASKPALTSVKKKAA